MARDQARASVWVGLRAVVKWYWAEARKNSAQGEFFSLFIFFIVSIFLSYFNFKSNQVLNSKFQIYAQEKLHMMHNFYIVFLHLFYYYIN